MIIIIFKAKKSVHLSEPSSTCCCILVPTSRCEYRPAHVVKQSESYHLNDINTIERILVRMLVFRTELIAQCLSEAVELQLVCVCVYVCVCVCVCVCVRVLCVFVIVSNTCPSALQRV